MTNKKWRNAKEQLERFKKISKELAPEVTTLFDKWSGEISTLQTKISKLNSNQKKLLDDALKRCWNTLYKNIPKETFLIRLKECIKICGNQTSEDSNDKNTLNQLKKQFMENIRDLKLDDKTDFRRTYVELLNESAPLAWDRNATFGLFSRTWNKWRNSKLYGTKDGILEMKKDTGKYLKLSKIQKLAPKFSLNEDTTGLIDKLLELNLTEGDTNWLVAYICANDNKTLDEFLENAKNTIGKLPEIKTTADFKEFAKNFFGLTTNPDLLNLLNKLSARDKELLEEMGTAWKTDLRVKITAGIALGSGALTISGVLVLVAVALPILCATAMTTVGLTLLYTSLSAACSGCAGLVLDGAALNSILPPSGIKNTKAYYKKSFDDIIKLAIEYCEGQCTKEQKHVLSSRKCLLNTAKANYIAKLQQLFPTTQ